MKNSSVASRYAKAILAAAKESGSYQRVISEVSAIASALEASPESRSFLESPLNSNQDKLKVLLEALSGQKVSEEVVATLSLMAKRGRLGILPELKAAIDAEDDRHQGITRGVVRAARPLSVEAKGLLENKLGQALGKRVVLVFKEDPSILGGVVAQVGGWTFDDSIETHLMRLSEELNRRAQ
ncbi:MAG: ATP synthase F1 subunit delta [Bdellovibrionaceae bacterium]|nr:ATP synthase F1 subunit delta [Pseudobdellovibrionaceae bacterium]